jgi:Zn-dependent protease
MRQNTIPIGRILGIPIGLDYSWFLIVALFSWSLATGYYPDHYADWPTLQYWLMGGITAIMLFVSVLLHELGHSVVAMRYKIPVRRIRLMIFGGVAELGDDAPRPAAEFWIAIAGPVVSLILTGVFYVGAYLLNVVPTVEPLIALFSYLVTINLMLALFNMIPGFPLDGGRVFRAIIWGINKDLYKSTQIAANVGRLVSYGFMGLGFILLVMGDFSGGLWMGFIGFYLMRATQAELQASHWRKLLSDYTVEQVMRRQYMVIPAHTTLDQLVPYFIHRVGHHTFVIEENERSVGLLTATNLRDIPRSRWETTTVAEVMSPLKDLQQVAPDTGLWTALRRMETEGINPLPVTFGGQVLGLLRREDILGYLRNLQMLRLGSR